MNLIIEVIQDIIRMFKRLDVKTNLQILGMLIITVLISILFFVKFDNPVIEKWKENKEIRTHQVNKEKEAKKLQKEEDNNKENSKGKNDNSKEESNQGVTY